MTALRSARLVLLCLVAPLATPARAADPDPAKLRSDGADYARVIMRVAQMVEDEQVLSFARVRGLDLLNVTWEDTGRFENSSVGPNISDMTLQVSRPIFLITNKKDGATIRSEQTLMPVIRFPNFTDKTGDVSMDKLTILVGNERGDALKSVSLRTYLGNLRRYLSKAGSWAGEGQSLLADRDTHVLVSAQAAFLPIPKEGEATFNPVLFNYQSGRKNPAVLAIIATREGTSATIIDNARDGFDAGGAWGQRLYFNADGQRASFTGKRLSETTGVGQATVSLGDESGLNMVMLIQVPLKHRVERSGLSVGMLEGFGVSGAGSGGGGMGLGRPGGSDVEAAVIGHGAIEGPFVEVDGLPIERDPRFPVRVTVQFYKATSNGVVSRKDMVQIQAQIKRVMKDADYVGSLVTDGRTGRPTDWDGDHTQPPLAVWWSNFGEHYERESGLTHEQARAALRHVFPAMVAWRLPYLPARTR